MSDGDGTIYSPSEEENSSVLLDAGLGFAAYLLLSFLITAPAPFLISLFYLLIVL